MGITLGAMVTHFILLRIDGLDTFEHELAHALVALLFLRQITRFVSTRSSGGYVQHSGGFGGELGNHMIGLAPYYLPTFTIASVLFRPIVPMSWFPIFDGKRQKQQRLDRRADPQ